ncbi:MAG: chromosome segregation protein SMC [Syntrophomonadaceae bacterium]|nr:chromosome segregation protein SMC [Syntrophomonadaceae bacterium]
MYLKRLEIKGFKSFADQTELNLNPGINIIAGPNGCGKSNIVDAIRWVLGEGNIRNLRGYKNEDVIFNGTDKKKALGMALVDMTVDNSDGMLPLDYSEVTVSRKIFRSGESEFYLNKSRVRMRDIVKLYTDTGLGRRGYSIISQGELERVLNGQPFDRRLMLEEAAGTMRYRQHRDEVGQRLMATTQDLLRVEDIINELAGRKTELHNKAEKARTYLAVRAEHDDLEKQVMAFQIKEINDNLQTRAAELDKVQSVLQETGAGLENLKYRLQCSEARLDENRIDSGRLNDERHELEVEINRLGADLKLGRERIKNYRERIAAAVKDRDKYIINLEKLEQDIQVKKDDFNAEKELYEQRKAEADELGNDIIKLRDTIQEQGRGLEQQNKLVFESANREAQFKNEMTDLENKIKKTQEKQERLLIRLDENKEQLAGLSRNRAELGDRIKDNGLSLEKWEAAVAAAEVERNEHNQSQASLNQEYDSINRERMKLEHKKLVLADLQRNYAGYSAGVKALLGALARGGYRNPGITGPVAGLIQVPAGMEVALEIALGRGMENIVVNTAESARKAIAYLRQQQLGRVTFLPLDVLRVQPLPARIKDELKTEPGVLGLASDLIKYDAQYEKAIAYLLGRVLVVKDMDCGMRIFKKMSYSLRLVTLAGELINTFGAITGGSVKQQPSNPLQRSREEKQVNQRLAELQKAEEINRQAAAKLAEQLQGAEDRLQEGRNNQTQLEIQLKIIREEEMRIEKLIESTSLDRDIYIRDISQLDEDLRLMTEELQKLQNQYREIRADNGTIAEVISSLSQEMEANQREHELRKERFSSHQERLAMKRRELENYQRNIAQFDQVKQSYEQSAAEAQTLQERLQADIDLDQARTDSWTQKIESKTADLNNIINKLEGARGEEQKTSREIERMRAEILPLEQQNQEQLNLQRQLEMKMVRLDTELKGLHSQWQEKYYPAEASVTGCNLTARQLRENRLRIEELRSQIELLGPIDIESIKEYDDIKTRYDFLCQQTEDLTAAKSSLQNLLKETEKIMANNFSKFIALADESFGRTFMEIFNGGEANLMIESVDDLAAGVDIVVKMPGKRSQSLNLLSGGERALTCIAFIFSLLRLKPAPFCLLDEIDASLDEVNLRRFADFLRGMSSDTQFIVITHRQATIEAGSNIYGITMPQEGISSVLSLNCDKIRDLAG